MQSISFEDGYGIANATAEKGVYYTPTGTVRDWRYTNAILNGILLVDFQFSNCSCHSAVAAMNAFQDLSMPRPPIRRD